MNPRSMGIRALPVFLWLVLALSGCQVAPQVEKVSANYTDESVLLRELKLRELVDFQFSGGVGVWTETDSIPARIRWAQSEDDLEVQFSGPLGLGNLNLQDKSGAVTLLRGKTVVTSGTSSDDVIQRGLGLTAPVPIEELKQWVRGLTGTGEAVVRDSDGRVSSLRYVDQSGVRWSVRFKRYEMVGELSLPALITASGGEYSVRLLLKNWGLTTNLTQSGANEANKRLSIPGR
jgi:outer membrane lipoprotein LolB